MANYHDLKVTEGIEPIEGSGVSDIELRYRHYTKGLTPNVRLVGVYDKLVRKVVVDTTPFYDFEEFEGQYKQGIFVDRNYYLVPIDRLTK